jgi:nucleotide-binding universal stress UspA family protein
VGTRELPAAGPRRIAVALDGSSRAEAAIDAALALSPGSTIDCLLVRATRLPLHAKALGAKRQESEHYLTRLAERMEGRGNMHVEWRAPVSGTPAAAILTAATRWRADLLALATRERSEARRILLGSVADHLVRLAPLPVLVCHAGPALSAVNPKGES